MKLLYKIDNWLYYNLPRGNYGKPGAKPNIFVRLAIRYRRFLTGYADPLKWYHREGARNEDLRREVEELKKQLRATSEELTEIYNRLYEKENT
jgi:hypothetical protein